ncbi:hypothetical protein L2D71_32435, partial [Pseudomonas aeruginosa]|uniref:hypothetical protein n=1 Tax=Pseudomonas aeruginosa TaxID=287 RepID=UPI001F1EF2B1
YGALQPSRVVILGSSTEALLTAIALREAGVEVAAIVEQAADPLGPAEMLATLREGGTEILAGHVVREAVGRDAVEAALAASLDDVGRPTGEE